MSSNYQPPIYTESTESEPEIVFTKPAVIVSVIRDNMEAEVKFQKTSAHTLDPQPEDVFAALSENGVVRGIDEARIREFCIIPTYEQPFVAAKGQPPATGRDGWVEYLIETHRELKPTIREDGTADYKDTGYIQSVSKGQTLCVIHPPEKGEDGWDVMDNVVDGLLGKQPGNPQGANTQLSEDGSQLISAVDGHVEVRRGTVVVLEVMRIQGNVDNATGNIIFPGDVMVQGDVASGFTIASGGSIVVRGTVEGATLEARRDITVSEGVNGMNRCSLSAGGSVKCRFMQSCIIHSDENVYADTIMYCTLECGGDVELSGKRGALIGGRSSIVGKLSAKTLGAESHPATEIRMCAASTAKTEEMEALKGALAGIDSDVRKLAQVMARFEDLAKKGGLRPEHRQSLEQVKASYIDLTTRRKQTEERLAQVQQEVLRTSAENSYIRCHGRIHTGVRLSFGPLNMVVQESFKYSRIGVIDKQIKIIPL